MRSRLLAASLLAASLALCVSPEPARATPPRQTGWIQGQIHALRLPARYRLARMRIKRSRVGKAYGAIARRVKHASMLVHGHLTLAVDRLELGLSPSLARRVHRIRAFNPLSVGAFAFHKIRQDPVFLATYGAFTFGLSNLQTPLLIAMGVSPLAAAAIRVVTGTPVDLGVLLWREHRKHRRVNPNATLRGTLRHVGREYNRFVEQRRTERRRFMAARQGGGLRALAGPLAP